MDWSRRDVLAGVGAAAGVGLGLVARAVRTDTWGPCLLRPPGALAERAFLGACIRCGQCVEACPFESIRLTVGMRAGVANGTPYVDSRDVPCYLCQGYDELRCIVACPSTALSPVDGLGDIRMGTAVIDASICLAYNDVVCRACWHACPFPDEAIKFDSLLRPVVDGEHCIGCGLCDHACPTEPSAIPVRSRCEPEGGSAIVGSREASP